MKYHSKGGGIIEPKKSTSALKPEIQCAGNLGSPLWLGITQGNYVKLIFVDLKFLGTTERIVYTFLFKLKKCCTLFRKILPIAVTESAPLKKMQKPYFKETGA